MDIKNQLTRLIEKGVSGWERWVSTVTSKAKESLLRVCTRVRLTTEHLTLSKLKQLTQVKDLLKKGAKHLIWLVADYVMLISWLLLLTLLVPLYVMVQALVLSLQGLMCILTKR